MGSWWTLEQPIHSCNERGSVMYSLDVGTKKARAHINSYEEILRGEESHYYP